MQNIRKTGPIAEMQEDDLDIIEFAKIDDLLGYN